MNGILLHRSEASQAGESVVRATPDIEKAIEAAARALCRLEGNPENTRFEGKPMWTSYIREATAAIEAAMPYLRLGT